jgi:hypothetical protein
MDIMNTNFRYIIILLLANLLFLSSEANGQNLSPASGEINGHQWVDLGLPSGLKWATCNVGASTPEDPGDYFAYGEVSEKDSYVFNNSINLQKEIRHISGRSEYDAATVHWGKEWRIPTYHEVDELEYNCRMEWTTINGKNGYKLTSLINGASIFLPATGLVDGTQPEFTQECGWYWYSGFKDPTEPEDPPYAPSFTFSANSRYRGFNARYIGQCIRPVSGRNRHVENPQTGTTAGHEWVDLGLPSGIRWATCNVGASLPTKPGKHFSWGETASKSSYTTSKLSEMDVEDIAGNPAYDAATAAWGKNWRMPTEENFRELTRYCRWEYVDIDGVNGVLFTSLQNNKSIFFPATGYIEGTTLDLGKMNGFYWASTPDRDSNTGAYGFTYGYPPIGDLIGVGAREYGRCVRPVTDNPPMEANEIVPYDGEIGGHRWVDLGLPSGLKWATYNVGATSAAQLGRLFKWGEIYDIYDKRPKNNLSKKPIRDIQGNPAYDAARANWGETWRLPSEEDFQELLDNCTIAFAYICGTRGFKLTSKINGKYIFLPEAGHDSTGNGTWHDIGWRHCVYWSSTSKDLYYYTYEDVGVSLTISQNLSVGYWDKEKQEYDNRYVGRIIKLEGGPRWHSSAVRPVSD